MGGIMKTFSRRDVLKTSLLAPAVAATAHAIGPIESTVHAAGEVSGPLSAPATIASPTPGAGRERLLLDFGWSFHFGNADDPTKDFGYGTADAGNFQKTGNFMPAGSTSFSDADWRRIDLPHDWTVELPFKNDPDLQKQGLLSSGPELSRNQYRLVPAHLRRCRPKTRASISRSNSMARTARPRSCSTGSISASTAVDTIHSALTCRTL